MHSLHKPQINHQLKAGKKIFVIIWWLTSNILEINVCYYEVMSKSVHGQNAGEGTQIY